MIESSVWYFVEIKPQVVAKEETWEGERVWNSGVHLLRPCKCKPVWEEAYGRTCSSKESSQS